MPDSIGLLSIGLLVILNGCFVAAEYALVTVRWTRIEELVAQNVLGARAVQHATEHMEEMIAATQLGITLCSLGVGWLGEPALARIVQRALAPAHLPWSVLVSHGIAIAIAFLAITY